MINSTTVKYKHIFFDLDHTLWDYESNAEESLEELYTKYQLDQFGLFSFNEFHAEFNKINHLLWTKYNKGLLGRDDIRAQRFLKILQGLGLHQVSLSQKLSEDYLSLCPTKSKLLPYAEETLAYLGQRYELSIITNGFTEIQNQKLKGSNIDHHFKFVTTSENANSRKPAKKIFDFAIGKVSSTPAESLMVGDSLLADIGGALSADIDAVYFNPKATPHAEKVTYEVDCLSKLMNML